MSPRPPSELGTEARRVLRPLGVGWEACQPVALGPHTRPKAAYQPHGVEEDPCKGRQLVEDAQVLELRLGGGDLPRAAQPCRGGGEQRGTRPAQR